jgi:hypothetical protein
MVFNVPLCVFTDILHKNHKISQLTFLSLSIHNTRYQQNIDEATVHYYKTI